jgi:hypothetical protein
MTKKTKTTNKTNTVVKAKTPTKATVSDADIVSGVYDAINATVKEGNYVASMVATEMSSVKGRSRLLKVAILIKADAMKLHKKTSKYPQWNVLKTQISRCSDTLSLKGAGDKQDVEISTKNKAQGGTDKTPDTAKVDTTTKTPTQDKTVPVSITLEQVSTFVIDHLSEEQLLELVQAWHLKNDDLKVAI